MKDSDAILNLIEENIFKDNFQKVSINYIASTLKMSKKTIYKHFQSKDELLLSLVDRYHKRIKDEMENIVKQNIHAVEKIYRVSEIISKVSVKFSDRVIAEIRIHYPIIWTKTELFRTEIMYKVISKIFSQGIKEGYIINIPTSIILTVYQSANKSIVDPNFIMHNNFSIRDAMRYTYTLLLNGILTEKGRKKFRLINKEKFLGINI